MRSRSVAGRVGWMGVALAVALGLACLVEAQSTAGSDPAMMAKDADPGWEGQR